MASYGYFHLIGKKFKDEKEYGDRKNTEITLHDILDSTYKGYVTSDHTTLINPEELKGDFGKIQTQQFFAKYDMLIHQPNTHSGFSATLFQDKESKEYTLAIRGTEFKLDQIQDLINDYYIGTNNSDMNRVIEQYFDMLLFYEETLKPLLQEKGIAKINVIGHSLGGYLAQLFALSYPSIINEVYTYNAPGIMSDKITNTLYWVAQGIGFTLAAKSIKCIFRAKTIISSFGSLFSSIRPFEAKNVLLNKQDKDVIVGIIPIRSSYKNVIRFNNMNNDDSMEQRIISNTYTNDVPYFLRDDGYKFANENRQPIFYYKDIGKYAREFYELMSDSGYEGKYLYYQYTLHNATTQASVAKFDYLILDYDLSAPYSEMVNRLQFMTENKQYPDPIITNNNIFRVVSIDNKGAMDTIGYLGNHMFGYDSSIVVETTNIINTHSIIPLTQTLYLYSYLLDSQSNYDKVKDKDINKCIEYLNTFMQGVYKVFNPLSIVINNKNLTPYKTQEKRPDSTDFLPIFIEHILYVTSLEKERESIYIQLHTTKDNIIDKIIVLSAEEYYPKILDKQDIDKLDPKQCSIAEKRAIFKCQPFTIIDRDGNEVLSKNNIAKLFRYNSNSTKIALYSDESNTSYFDARISMMKNILYENEMRVYHIREAN